MADKFVKVKVAVAELQALAEKYGGGTAVYYRGDGKIGSAETLDDLIRELEDGAPNQNWFHVVKARAGEVCPVVRVSVEDHPAIVIDYDADRVAVDPLAIVDPEDE